MNGLHWLIKIVDGDGGRCVGQQGTMTWRAVEWEKYASGVLFYKSLRLVTRQIYNKNNYYNNFNSDKSVVILLESIGCKLHRAIGCVIYRIYNQINYNTF
jgi:hypothetical protein